jgi:hypothetical protein
MLFNKTITPIERLVAIADSMKGQKQIIVECEIKERALTNEITHVKLTGGGNVNILTMLGQQQQQSQMLHNGTSEALKVTRQMLYELYEENKDDKLFADEFFRLFKDKPQNVT